MCLQERGYLKPNAVSTFNAEAAGQVYNEAHNFVYLWGNISHDSGPLIKAVWRICNAWCSVRSPRSWHNDALRRVHLSLFTEYIELRKYIRTDHPIS